MAETRRSLDGLGGCYLRRLAPSPQGLGSLGERGRLEGTYFFNRDNAVEVPANAVSCQMGQKARLAIGQSH